MSELAANLEIRRLSQCSFDDAVKIWNLGFQGYFVDMTLSLDSYLARLQRDALSPEVSLVVYYDGVPAGFLLNGIRTTAGLKLAWNGGTGVAPQFRGRGVGKALMRATLDLYGEQGIERAMLEAISENETAIALYRKFGYEVVDRLGFFDHEGVLSESTFRKPNLNRYSVAQVEPYLVGALDFYQETAPWQAHWQSLTRDNGQALIVTNASGAAVGYALYRKKRDLQGKTVDCALHQCVARPGEDAEAIIGCALRSAYAPFDLECTRSTYNFSMSNAAVVTMLIEAGFTSSIEQVHMVRTFSS